MAIKKQPTDSKLRVNKPSTIPSSARIGTSVIGRVNADFAGFVWDFSESDIKSAADSIAKHIEVMYQVELLRSSGFGQNEWDEACAFCPSFSIQALLKNKWRNMTKKSQNKPQQVTDAQSALASGVTYGGYGGLLAQMGVTSGISYNSKPTKTLIQVSTGNIIEGLDGPLSDLEQEQLEILYKKLSTHFSPLNKALK